MPMRRTPVAVLSIALGAAAASAQGSHASPLTSWTITGTLGGFARGNGDAVVSWLRHNAYGASEPQRCVLDLLFQRTCSAADPYPRFEHRQLVAYLASARGNLTENVSLEIFYGTEQSGTAIGRCDDSATPRDARCKDRFMPVDFGGMSFAMMPVLATRHLHVGGGPAFFLADWQMRPRNLLGLWFDATFSRASSPFFLRAQYRVYRSASFAPERQFGGLRASTLFLGLGAAGGIGDSDR
jgi:hypothetical protein